MVKSYLQFRNPRLDPWVGKIPGKGNGNLLQNSYLGNPMNRGDWRATVHGVAKELDTTERLNDNIEYITNESLLYSSRNPPQCSVVT